MDQIYGGYKDAIFIIGGSALEVTGLYSCIGTPFIRNAKPINLWIASILHKDPRQNKYKTQYLVASERDKDWHILLNHYEKSKESLLHATIYIDPPTYQDLGNLRIVKPSEDADVYDIVQIYKTKRFSGSTEYKIFTKEQGPHTINIHEWESIMDEGVHYYTIQDMMIRKDDNDPILDENGNITKTIPFIERLRKLNFIV